VVGAHQEVVGGEGEETPVGVGAELFLFVLAGDCGGYFLVLLVYGLDGDGCALFGFAV
jgi:hypothetical protein